MAISQQAIQTVEFLELRRVFKEESNDIEKVDKQILDVLKDNNAILKDLVDKIQLASITKGLGKQYKPKKEKSNDNDLDPNAKESLGNVKDFITGFKERIKDYKEFFFGKKFIPEIEEKPTTGSKLEPLIESKYYPIDEKIPTPKFEGMGERQQINKPLLLESPKVESKTPLLQVPKKKQYDVIDVSPIQSKTPFVKDSKVTAPLMLGNTGKINSDTSSFTIPSKLIEDIASIKKAMLSDGIMVKVTNFDEFKINSESESSSGASALDVVKSGLDIVGDSTTKVKGAEKTGSKASKFLGMAGKAARVLGPAAAVAGAAYSGIEGYQNTASNFDLKEDEEATLGQKVSSTLGGIASGATFGLLSEKTAAQGIQKAGEFVGDKAKAAYEGAGNFFGNLGGKVKNVFSKGIDEGTGVAQADQKITTASELKQSDNAIGSTTLSSSNLQEGMSTEKTVLGSTFLGKLFSKKGTTTGQFYSGSSKQNQLIAEDVGEHGNVSNLNNLSSSALLGERKAGGILSRDIYSVQDGQGEKTDLTRTEYNKIQKQVEAGKTDDAQKTLQRIKDMREIDKQYAQVYGRTPEDMVTPMTEISRTNEDLKRQNAAPVNLPPVVSNTTQTNNTQTLAPIKAQPRGALSSSLERYVDRTAVYA